MSATGVPTQLINQTFDFALLYVIKGFWKEYKSTFSLAQLMKGLQENKSIWMSSNQRNCNETTFHTTVHLSLQRLMEQAGIIVHRNIIPHLYELVDYDQFLLYEKGIITVLYDTLIEVNIDEHIDLPFMGERSYQFWLLKQHDHQQLKYSLKAEAQKLTQNQPCIRVISLTEMQLSYLVRKAIRYNLVSLPPFSSSIN